MMNKHAFYVIKQESQRRLLLTSEIMLLYLPYDSIFLF